MMEERRKVKAAKSAVLRSREISKSVSVARERNALRASAQKEQRDEAFSARAERVIRELASAYRERSMKWAACVQEVTRRGMSMHPAWIDLRKEHDQECAKEFEAFMERQALHAKRAAAAESSQDDGAKAVRMSSEAWASMVGTRINIERSLQCLQDMYEAVWKKGVGGRVEILNVTLEPSRDGGRVQTASKL